VRSSHSGGKRTSGGGLKQALEEKVHKRVKCVRKGGEMAAVMKVI
jgi:hypothetical protein